jgi:hypothetical protein
MKAKSIVTTVLLVSVFVSVAFAEEPQKIDLKLRFKPGDKRDLKITQQQNITQTMNDQEMKTVQNQEMIMGFDVLSVDANGIADVKMSYKQMKIKIDAPDGMTFEYDSAKPAAVEANDSNDPNDPRKQAEKMLSAVFSSMSGCSITMKIKPTGETSVDANSLNQMMEKMGSIGGQEAAMMREFMKKFFNENEVKEMTGNMLGVFPAEPVAVGDVWYDSMSMNLGFPLDVDTTYILKARKNGVAVIDSIAKMDMGDAEKSIDMGPMKMNMQLAGAMNGTSEVEEATGWTKKSAVTMTFSGIIKMAANEQMPQGLTIPMTISGTVTVEPIKAE